MLNNKYASSVWCNNFIFIFHATYLYFIKQKLQMKLVFSSCLSHKLQGHIPYLISGLQFLTLKFKKKKSYHPQPKRISEEKKNHCQQNFFLKSKQTSTESTEILGGLGISHSPKYLKNHGRQVKFPVTWKRETLLPLLKRVERKTWETTPPLTSCHYYVLCTSNAQGPSCCQGILLSHVEPCGKLVVTGLQPYVAWLTTTLCSLNTFQ